MIEKKIKQLNQELKWACHATLTSFAGKRKFNTNHFLPNNNQIKKNPKVSASRSNAIFMKPRTSSKKLNANSKNKKKKQKTPSTNKESKSQSKYSKKVLYAEIKSLKKSLKKLILD